ncbi:MAG: hypothetical protein EZS28_053240, partial [Streblomastix strix]
MKKLHSTAQPFQPQKQQPIKPFKERIICVEQPPPQTDTDHYQTKTILQRSICVSGEIDKIDDVNLWSFLGRRGKLVQITLKYDELTQKQKNYCYAEYATDIDVERTLLPGQNQSWNSINVWLEKMLQTKSLVVFGIREQLTLKELLTEAWHDYQ